MKNLNKIITALLLLCSLKAVAVNPKTIDFSFEKIFRSEYAYIDLNGNRRIDDDEILKGDVTVYFKFRDFGMFGSYLYIEFLASNGKKEVQFVARYEDVTVKKRKRDYEVRNRLGELLFTTGKIKCYKNVICIHDITSYRLLLTCEIR